MRKLLLVASASCAATILFSNLANATPFTMTSPINGGTALPAGVTQVGGLVFHAKGLNGAIVTSQIPASSLFVGFADDGTPVAFRGNPLTIGIQTGFTPAVTGALGGGFSELAVRITLFDGDTGLGNFDDNNNFLQLNGIEFGAASNFSNVVTQQTNGTGTIDIGPPNAAGGFRDNILDTGFFHFTNIGDLANLFASILASQQIVFRLRDVDPFDNFYDFTRGVDGGLINVGQPPTIDVVPEPASLAAFGVAGLFGFGAFLVRRRRKATALAA